MKKYNDDLFLVANSLVEAYNNADKSLDAFSTGPIQCLDIAGQLGEFFYRGTSSFKHAVSNFDELIKQQHGYKILRTNPDKSVVISKIDYVETL